MVCSGEPGKEDAYLPPPWPGPLAGGDDLCLLRAGHGSVERGHKREQGKLKREKGECARVDEFSETIF